MTDLDLEERLAKIRAEREAIERAREEREQAEMLRRRIEAEERALADAKAIAEAEEKLGHGKYAAVKTPLGVVIVKRPNAMHYRKFVATKDITPDDAERLVLQCLVHPSRSAFEMIAEEYPAIPLEVASAVLDLAAGRQREIEGKS